MTVEARPDGVDARVVSEPLTYAPDSPHGFFRDHLAPRSDFDAKNRLARHAREVRVESRANPSRVPGQGGEFTLPEYLVSKFAKAPRPERVISELSTRFPLKRGVGKILIPRVVSGNTLGPGRANNADYSGNLETAQAESEVVLISGHVDVPMQVLEQSPLGAPFDMMMFQDMLGAYDAALERQLTLGEGEKDELLGILNVPGRGTVNYTAVTPKAVEMYQRIGEVFGSVSNNRRKHLEAWFMRGGRWAWIASGEDVQSRPLVAPFDTHELTEGINPVGRMIGVSVFLSETLPSRLGAEANTDVIVGARPSDFMLWEEEVPSFGGVEVLTDVLSGALEVRLRLRGYAAFVASRFPSSICTLTGTGMKVFTNL